ncbi:MAG TPA: flagellar FliJ family protein [Fimbriimonadaceae bacterium]|nr:flagellar FliJ family protein [Fimbriimonadaceae bacterium]
MKKFSFRLQKVLEYREMVESWAKEAYLDARTARLEAEVSLLGIESRRQEMLREPVGGLDGRLNLQARLQKLDDQETEKRTILQVLIAEEERSLAEWTEKRLELEALQKLKEKALEEWKIEAQRYEQAELDEWAVLRRAA